jgi:hypothetical protein
VLRFPAAAVFVPVSDMLPPDPVACTIPAAPVEKIPLELLDEVVPVRLIAVPEANEETILPPIRIP